MGKNPPDKNRYGFDSRWTNYRKQKNTFGGQYEKAYSYDMCRGNAAQSLRLRGKGL